MRSRARRTNSAARFALRWLAVDPALVEHDSAAGADAPELTERLLRDDPAVDIAALDAALDDEELFTAERFPASALDDATLDALVKYVENGRDRMAEVKPNPGRTTLHRLNRTEYGNAVRDLLALEIDVA